MIGLLLSLCNAAVKCDLHSGMALARAQGKHPKLLLDRFLASAHPYLGVAVSVAPGDVVTTRRSRRAFSSVAGPGGSEDDGARGIARRISWQMVDVLDRLRGAHKKVAPKRSQSQPEPSRTEAAILSVAEQRILQSFREGQFDNLPGHGKPLPLDHNAYNDPADEVAFRVLKNTGFAPRWVELNKDIRFLIRRWRLALGNVASRKGTAELATEAVNQQLDVLKKMLEEINKKVLHHNLIAPFGRQMMHFKFDKELRDVAGQVQAIKGQEGIKG